MSGSQNERIREELERFMVDHMPSHELMSELDEVVVEFVAGMVCSDESDIDQLTEMLTAYIPQLGEIPTDTVNEWARKLLSLFSENTTNGADCKQEGEDSIKLHNLLDIMDKSDGKENEPCPNPLVNQRDLDKLSDMFPKVPLDHITECLRQANGHMDTAVELLLADYQVQKVSSNNDMAQIKDLILSRYGYVDTDADKTFHKPHLPLAVPGDKGCSKVRYRDNQIVNTKGERFTIITKKDQEGEHMKETYINLKPGRKYRFH